MIYCFLRIYVSLSDIYHIGHIARKKNIIIYTKKKTKSEVCKSVNILRELYVTMNKKN